MAKFDRFGKSWLSSRLALLGAVAPIMVPVVATETAAAFVLIPFRLATIACAEYVERHLESQPDTSLQSGFPLSRQWRRLLHWLLEPRGSAPGAKEASDLPGTSISDTPSGVPLQFFQEKPLPPHARSDALTAAQPFHVYEENLGLEEDLLQRSVQEFPAHVHGLHHGNAQGTLVAPVSTESPYGSTLGDGENA